MRTGAGWFVARRRSLVIFYPLPFTLYYLPFAASHYALTTRH
jgi:hypothetical protein